MKQINKSKIGKVFITIALICIPLAIAYFGLLRKPIKNYFLKKKREAAEMAVTEPAPYVSRVLNYGEEYYREENGNLVIRNKNKDYVVLPDGTVWEYDLQGNLVPVTDKKIIQDVLIKALGALEDDDIISKSLIEGKIDLSTLTDNQIKELANILGVSENDLKEAVTAAKKTNATEKTVSDIMKKLDLTTLSDDELKEVAKELNIPFSELKKAVNKAKEENRPLSIKEFLESSVENDEKDALNTLLKRLGRTDLTADDILKILDENDMSFEDFMNKFFNEGADSALAAIGLGKEEKKTEEKSQAPSGGILNSGNNSSDYNTSYLTTPKPVADASQELSFLKELNTQNPQTTVYEQVNNQAEKKSFVKEFQNGNKIEQVSKKAMKYMLVTGQTIDAVLETGLNTDLPGQIKAIVTRDVYDYFSATNVLVPAGSRVIATYDSSVSWGQERVLVAWQTLIRPDGLIVRLNGSQGIDTEGHSGFDGDVNNHIGQILGSTAMASLISAATGQYNNIDTDSAILKAMLAGTSTAVNTVAQNLLNNSINRQPTITKNVGEPVKIFINNNIELPIYRDAFAR